MQQLPGLNVKARWDKEKGPYVDSSSLWTKETVTSAEALDWPIWKKPETLRKGPTIIFSSTSIMPCHPTLPSSVSPVCGGCCNKYSLY